MLLGVKHPGQCWLDEKQGRTRNKIPKDCKFISGKYNQQQCMCSFKSFSIFRFYLNDFVFQLKRKISLGYPENSWVIKITILKISESMSLILQDSEIQTVPTVPKMHKKYHKYCFMESTFLFIILGKIKIKSSWTNSFRRILDCFIKLQEELFGKIWFLSSRA